MIGNRPRRKMEGPPGDRHEDNKDRLGGHEIHLEKEDVLDKNKTKKNIFGLIKPLMSQIFKILNLLTLNWAQ